MRTYDDTFSGEKIYPGRVCLPPASSLLALPVAIAQLYQNLHRRRKASQ
jgi:hypothetical protein